MTYRPLLVAIAAFSVTAAVTTPTLAQSPAETQVLSVLEGYKASIEALNAPGAEPFFWPDSQVFEQGGVEGSFAEYLAHHLGPEFDAVASFDFQDHVAQATVVGDLAYATETYTYRITFKDASRAPIERRGVATSVLRQRDGAWRIVNYHSSARAPRPAT